MTLKVKIGGEVGYFDCGDIVELAAHFDLDLSAAMLNQSLADASRGLFDHRLFAEIIWKSLRILEVHGCVAAVKATSWNLLETYFMR